MIKGFAGYSFSKAHAAAFAVIVYWSAWLRVHYPAEYFCGLLRAAPLGTYPARVLEAEARRVGIRFLPFNINLSDTKPNVEDGAIRHGLGYIKGIGKSRADLIMKARQDGPFQSVADIVRRTKLNRRAMESLVLAGALDCFGERRQLLWDLVEAMEVAQRPPALGFIVPGERPALPAMTSDERTLATFGETGVTVDRHLADLRSAAFRRAGCLTLAEVKKKRIGSAVRIGGMIADGVRTPPTAHGTGFLRLENVDGLVDIIVPAALLADRAIRNALRAVFVVVEGTVREQNATPSVVATRVDSLQ